MKKSEPGEIQKDRTIREPSQQPELTKTNREGSRRRDQRAVAWRNGLPVGPHLPLGHARSATQPRARHERIIVARRAPFRWDLGSGAPLLPFVPVRPPSETLRFFRQHPNRSAFFNEFEVLNAIAITIMRSCKDRP